MNQTKTLQTLGIVFLACGAPFLAIGVATQMLAFTVLGPSFMVLGVVFFATSKARRKPIDNSETPNPQVPSNGA